MRDPIWWTTFDYKLALASTVITGLAVVGGGIWRLSRRYTLILNELKNKVSHPEMAACKQEITQYISESNKGLKQELKQEIKDDHDDNKNDHKAISDQITNLTSWVMVCNKNRHDD
jgi:hypothetical protein